jgi:hypothetical protein
MPAAAAAARELAVPGDPCSASPLSKDKAVKNDPSRFIAPANLRTRDKAGAVVSRDDGVAPMVW